MNTGEYIREAVERAVPDSLSFDERRLGDIKRLARRRQRTRGVGLGVGAAAIATAGIFGAVAALGGADAPQIEVATSSDTNSDMPPPQPYSDTEVPDGEAVLPGPSYVVAADPSGETDWKAVTMNPVDGDRGCVMVLSDDLYDTPMGNCFDTWKVGKLTRFDVYQGDRDSSITIVAGATGMSARSVIIRFDDGSSTVVDAVATPASGDLRFFAASTPSDVTVRDVEPLDDAGEPALPPDGLPWRYDCPDICPTEAPH